MKSLSSDKSICQKLEPQCHLSPDSLHGISFPSLYPMIAFIFDGEMCFLKAELKKKKKTVLTCFLIQYARSLSFDEEIEI